MAEERMEIPWVKAPGYRTIRPSAASVSTVDVGEGITLYTSFTTTVIDIEKETIPTVPLEGALAGSRIQSGPSEFTQRPIKIVEVMLKLTPELVGSLIPLLLGPFEIYPESVKKQIKEAFANLPNK